MKNSIILPVLLGTTLVVAGCAHSIQTPNPPAKSNTGTNSTIPKTMIPTTHTETGSSVHTDNKKDDRSASSEEWFITGMIPHHQEAVDAAKIIVAKTQNQELKKVAQAIIDAQNKEITQLKGWMKAWYPNSMIKTESMPMMRDLTKLSGHELDDAFMEDMIKHHEEAIHMAKDVLEISQRSEIMTIAKDIISSQTSEIAMFKKMLANH